MATPSSDNHRNISGGGFSWRTDPATDTRRNLLPTVVLKRLRHVRNVQRLHQAELVAVDDDAAGDQRLDQRAGGLREPVLQPFRARESRSAVLSWLALTGYSEPMNKL